MVEMKAVEASAGPCDCAMMIMMNMMLQEGKGAEGVEEVEEVEAVDGWPVVEVGAVAEVGGYLACAWVVLAVKAMAFF